MPNTTQIRLLHRQEIDTSLWDEAIAASPDARVYANSWFLDKMAPGWQALITEGYKVVMPLPVRRKFGINYIFQPAFCQQLGVFAQHSNIDTATADAFLKKVQQQFSYAELNLHSGHNELKGAFKLRKNYLLPLKGSFKDLSNQFSRSAKRNVKKAMEAGITVASESNPAPLIHLHRQRYQNQLAGEDDLNAIHQVFEYAGREGKGHFYYAKDPSGNNIASSGYLYYKDRLVFLMNGNLPEGLQTGATHLLKHYVIESFAGNHCRMDFEGSDTPSFARFYEQYGATACDNYPFIIFNRLPIPFRWLKPGHAL